MKELENKISELTGELYYLTYIMDIYVKCPMASNKFQTCFLNDERIKELYRDYKKTTDNPLSIRDWVRNIIKNDTELFYTIVRQFINLSEEQIPEQIYIDEELPFRFEYLSTMKPTFEEFKIELNSEFLSSIKKLFYDLNDDEIKRRNITFLENKVKLEQDKINEQRIAHLPVKSIYKYNKNGILEKIYNSRKECCEAEGFKKAALSLHLSGARKYLNGYIYKEV